MAGRQDNVDKNHHLYAKQICWKRNACENADRTVKHMVARTDFMRKKTEANAKWTTEVNFPVDGARSRPNFRQMDVPAGTT